MIFDLVVLVLLLLAAISGWRSGLVAMLLSLVILILAVLGASAFADSVGNILKIGPLWSRPVIGFIVTFIVLMIVGGWFKRLVSPRRGILRGFDGAAGAVLGFARAVLVLSIILGLFKLVHLPPERVTEKSVSYPIFLKTSTVVIDVLKPYIHTSGINNQSAV